MTEARFLRAPEISHRSPCGHIASETLISNRHFGSSCYSIIHGAHTHNVPFETIHIKWCGAKTLCSVGCLCATDGPSGAEGVYCIRHLPTRMNGGELACACVRAASVHGKIHEYASLPVCVGEPFFSFVWDYEQVFSFFISDIQLASFCSLYREINSNFTLTASKLCYGYDVDEFHQLKMFNETVTLVSR